MRSRVDIGFHQLPFTNRQVSPIAQELQRNTVHRNGEWLANTTVEKKLENDTKVAP